MLCQIGKSKISRLRCLSFFQPNFASTCFTRFLQCEWLRAWWASGEGKSELGRHLFGFSKIRNTVCRLRSVPERLRTALVQKRLGRTPLGPPRWLGWLRRAEVRGPGAYHRTCRSRGSRDQIEGEAEVEFAICGTRIRTAESSLSYRRCKAIQRKFCFR